MSTLLENLFGMVRVSRAGRPSSEYAALREDPTIDRWYRNVARGSAVTADVYLRRLGNICRANDKRPADLVLMKSDGRRDFLTDLVSSMESKGLSGGYVESTLKALRSWLSFNGVPWEHRIKVRGTQATPTLTKERVPTQDELRRIFLAASSRERVANLRRLTIDTQDELKSRQLFNVVLRDYRARYSRLWRGWIAPTGVGPKGVVETEAFIRDEKGPPTDPP